MLATTALIDWNDAFDNSSYIAGSHELADEWSTAAQAFRDQLKDRATLDIPYGAHAREQFDYFLPITPPLGTVIFIHGGYWQLFDKSAWSHFAEGSLARGWAVAIPSYTLAPEATIPHITKQVAAAITAIYRHAPGSIRLVGHSAGGHLVARMICRHSPLAADMQRHIANVVSISGVYDLRPLLQTEMNAILGLSGESALAESPLFQRPTDCPLTAWVGAQERPEFLRQNRLIAEKWERQRGHVREVYDAGHQHFSVINGLRSADSPLTDALLRAI